jgi:hypothetical protein
MVRLTSPNKIGRRMAVAIRNSPLWLALLGLSALGFGCASPVLTAPAAIVPTPALKGVRVALVDFVPLPKTYPAGAKPLFLSLTGELYEEEKVVTGPEVRTSSGEETVTIRTFVPRNHWAILTETMLLAMKEKGMAVEHAPSVAAAQQRGAAIIIAGVAKEFKVIGQATHRFEWVPTPDSYITGEANVRVWTVILSGHTGDRLWEGELKSRATHKLLISNAFNVEGMLSLEIDESSLHPLRAILAVTAYNIAAQLVEQLERTVATAAGFD